jgi:single stranded DNA-binding protein
MASTTTTSGKESTPKPRKDLVTKVGNIGSVKDDGTIELRLTANGKSVCNFDIAVNTGKGEDKRTEWYRITCWDTLADNVVACLTKGNRVIVWGVPDIEEYTDKEGNTRKQKKINAWSVGVDLNFQQASIQKIERNSSYDNQDEPF